MAAVWHSALRDIEKFTRTLMVLYVTVRALPVPWWYSTWQWKLYSYRDGLYVTVRVLPVLWWSLRDSESFTRTLMVSTWQWEPHPYPDGFYVTARASPVPWWSLHDSESLTRTLMVSTWQRQPYPYPDGLYVTAIEEPQSQKLQPYRTLMVLYVTVRALPVPWWCSSWRVGWSRGSAWCPASPWPPPEETPAPGSWSLGASAAHANVTLVRHCITNSLHCKYEK